MIGSVLQKLIEEKKTNVNELARMIDVSPQTLYSIIKRDNMKIDFEVLLKICKVLDTDIEVFYRDYVSQGDKKSAYYIDADEYLIVNKYRQLNSNGKEYIASQFDYALSLEKYNNEKEFEPAKRDTAV